MAGTFPLGKGRGLTPEELYEFLTGTAIFAKIATTGEDGWPAVSPVWYEYDGRAFWIVTKELTGFCQNLRRDPRASLCIDNPQPPYKRVLVRGRAELVDGYDWVPMARRMVLRYLGESGLRYFEATLELPRVTVRIVPERVSTWNGGGVDRTFWQPTRWHEVASGQALEQAVV